MGENDPALLISWEHDNLERFVAEANSPRVNQHPPWLRAVPLTMEEFQQDLIQFLCLVGGGSYGNSMVAPNTLTEYANVRMRLGRDIELDPFMQECIQQLPVGAVLGSLGEITDFSVANVRPANPPPPIALNTRPLFS